MNITKRSGEVLAFIARYIKEHSYGPTRRDICNEFGWGGVQAAHDHICRLVAAGLLTHKPRASRTFVITTAGHEWLAANAPAAAPSLQEDTPC